MSGDMTSVLQRRQAENMPVAVHGAGNSATSSLPPVYHSCFSNRDGAPPEKMATSIRRFI